MGQSPKSQFYNEAGEDLPFHQGVTDYGFRFVSHRIFSSAVTKIAEAGDILISVAHVWRQAVRGELAMAA